MSGKRAFNMKALADYRAEWMGVLNEILRRLLQRVKDCICEHLLVDCPTCDENDRLILACVEIRAKQVYNICNFHRREVVTFPKLFYWVSAVPLIPLITAAIERFCCLALARPSANLDREGNNLVTAKVVNENAVRIQTADFDKMQKALSGYLKMTSSFGAQAMVRKLGGRENLSRAVPADAVVNRAPATVKQTLAESGVKVNRMIPMDAAFEGKVIERMSAVPVGLHPGDEVDLYTRNGKVVFYTEATIAPRQLERAAPVAPDSMEMLTRRMGEFEASYRDSLERRDAQIAALKKDLDAVRALLEKRNPPGRIAGRHLREGRASAREVVAVRARQIAKQKQNGLGYRAIRIAATLEVSCPGPALLRFDGGGSGGQGFLGSIRR